jgi:hypothetical protein
MSSQSQPPDLPEINPFRAPDSDPADPEQVLEGSPAERIRRQFINHEADVKSIASLHLLGVVVGLSLVAGGAAMRRFSSLPWNITIDKFVLVVVGIALIAVSGVVGVGLYSLQPWSRIPAVVVSALWLLYFPIGTIVNAYALYLLLSRKGRYVFTEEYRAIVQQTPNVRYRTSPFVAVVAILLAAAFVLATITAILG